MAEYDNEFRGFIESAAHPLAIEISRALVDRNTTLQLSLVPGGGQAIRLRPASEEETGRVPEYRL